MESNSIVAAPQLDNVQELYSEWSADHEGGLGDFYHFITTPSAERDAFVSLHRHTSTIKFSGSILTVTINHR